MRELDKDQDVLREIALEPSIDQFKAAELMLQCMKNVHGSISHMDIIGLRTEGTGNQTVDFDRGVTYAVQQGFLEGGAGGGLRLTDKGRAALQKAFRNDPAQDGFERAVHQLTKSRK